MRPARSSDVKTVRFCNVQLVAGQCRDSFRETVALPTSEWAVVEQKSSSSFVFLWSRARECGKQAVSLLYHQIAGSTLVSKGRRPDCIGTIPLLEAADTQW